MTHSAAGVPVTPCGADSDPDVFLTLVKYNSGKENKGFERILWAESGKWSAVVVITAGPILQSGRPLTA